MPNSALQRKRRSGRDWPSHAEDKLREGVEHRDTHMNCLTTAMSVLDMYQLPSHIRDVFANEFVQSMPSLHNATAAHMAAFSDDPKRRPTLIRANEMADELPNLQGLHADISSQILIGPKRPSYELWPCNPTDDENSLRNGAAAVMAHLMQPPGVVDDPDPRRLLNVYPLKRYEKFFSANVELARKRHGEQAKLSEQGANVTPRGSLVAMHFDDLPTISTLVGGEKLWLIYPPSELRNFLYHYVTHEDGMTMTSRCIAGMRGGVFIRQGTGDKICVPAFTPHTVVTLDNGILIGNLVDADGGVEQLVCELDGGLDGTLNIETNAETPIDRRADFTARFEARLRTGTNVDLQMLTMAWLRNEPFTRALFADSPQLLARLVDAFQHPCVRQDRCLLCAASGRDVPLWSAAVAAAHLRGSHSSLPKKRAPGGPAGIGSGGGSMRSGPSTRKASWSRVALRSGASGLKTPRSRAALKSKMNSWNSRLRSGSHVVGTSAPSRIGKDGANTPGMAAPKSSAGDAPTSTAARVSAGRPSPDSDLEIVCERKVKRRNNDLFKSKARRRSLRAVMIPLPREKRAGARATNELPQLPPLRKKRASE